MSEFFATIARGCAAEIPDSTQKIYFRILCWIGYPRVIVEHRLCTSTPRCHT